MAIVVQHLPMCTRTCPPARTRWSGLISCFWWHTTHRLHAVFTCNDPPIDVTLVKNLSMAASSAMSRFQAGRLHSNSRGSSSPHSLRGQPHDKRIWSMDASLVALQPSSKKSSNWLVPIYTCVEAYLSSPKQVLHFTCRLTRPALHTRRCILSCRECQSNHNTISKEFECHSRRKAALECVERESW